MTTYAPPPFFIKVVIAIAAVFFTSSCQKQEDGYAQTAFDALKKNGFDVKLPVLPGPSTEKNPMYQMQTYAHQEMLHKLEKELYGIGDEETRRAILRRIAEEDLYIPDYIYEQVIVDQYLFEHYLLKTYGIYNESVVSSLIHPESPKADDDKEKLTDHRVKGVDSTPVMSKKAFDERKESLRNLWKFEGGYIADFLYVSAPQTVSKEELFKVLKEMRASVSDKVTEETMYQIYERWEKPLQEKGIHLYLKRGEKYQRQDSAKLKEGLKRAPYEVKEPEQALVIEGKLNPEANFSNCTTAPFDFQNRFSSDNQITSKGESLDRTHRVGFYLKLVEIPVYHPNDEDINRHILLESIYATSEWLAESNMLKDIRNGDWVFNAENLRDEQ